MEFDFFATDTDLLQVWQWLYDMPEMRLLESYSEPDEPNKWFNSWEEIEARLRSGNRHMTAWPSAVGGMPRVQDVVFNAETQQKLGARGRTVLRSAAFIDYIWFGEQRGCLGASSLTCWSEKGAAQRSDFREDMVAEVDWKAFRSTFGKIQRQIRKSASHKLHAAPIMPDAWRRTVNREIELWGWGEAVGSESPHLRPVTV